MSERQLNIVNKEDRKMKLNAIVMMMVGLVVGSTYAGVSAMAELNTTMNQIEARQLASIDAKTDSNDAYEADGMKCVQSIDDESGEAVETCKAVK